MYYKINFEVIGILVSNSAICSTYYGFQTMARTDAWAEGVALVVKVFLAYSTLLVMLVLFHYRRRGYKMSVIFLVLALATAVSFKDGNLVAARLIPSVAMAISLSIAALHVGAIKKLNAWPMRVLQVGLVGDGILALIYPLMSTSTDYMIGFGATAIAAIFTSAGFLAVVKERFEDLKKECSADDTSVLEGKIGN